MAQFFDSTKIALGGLTLHKGRSILTVLGIVIGIGSVMMVMSIGESAQQLVLGEVQSFGPTNVFVIPGRQPKGPNDAAGTLLNDSLKEKDLTDLENKANVPDAEKVIPYVFGGGNVAFESETYDATVLGSTPDIAKNFDLTVDQGRFFDSADVDSKNSVAVIGSKVANDLFAVDSPLNKKIKIKGQVLRVIGVLEKKGAGSLIDFDKAVIGPYSVIGPKILGIKYFQRIIVQATSIDTIPNVITDIETTLRNNHNIDDPEKDDFFIQTPESIADNIKTITSILTVLLASVAAISLIVGGVGIMNIMYVSVTERTREIGLRKALGATQKNVLSQFLFEAIMLTASGGIVGIIGGTVLSFLATYAAKTFASINFPFVFSLQGAILGVGVAVGIGLVFGIFPAYKASKKSPIEALRYE